MNQILFHLTFFLVFLISGFQLQAQCPPQTPLSATFTTTNSTCEANGKTTITPAGGRTPFSYEITAGPITFPLQTLNKFEALPPGNYTVVVYDFCGVSVSLMVTITGNYQIPNLTFVATDVFCPSTNDGTVEASVTNGLAPFSYRLIHLTAPPDTITQSSKSFTNLAPGDYKIQAFDQCGNFQTRNVLISEPVLAPFFASLTASNSYPPLACDQYRFATYARSTTPRLPFTYVLKDLTTNTAIRTGSVAHTFLFPITAAEYDHDYRIEYIDACGRIASDEASITPQVNVSGGITCDPGTINVLPQQFVPPVTWEILSGPEIRPVQATGSYIGLPLGDYIFQVTDACGLSMDRLYSVEEQDWSIFIRNQSNFACKPGFSTLGYNIGAEAVAPLSFELLAAPAGVVVPQTFETPKELGDVPPGTYDFAVTDDCGVMKTTSFTVVNTLELNYNTTVVAGCTNGNINLTGAFNNGKGMVRLEALDGTVLQPFVTQPFPNYTNLPLGDYVLAFNANNAGCANILDTIVFPPYLQPNLTLLTGVECTDGTLVVSGSPTGGIPPYTFELIAGPVTRPPQSSPIFTGLSLGTYDVRMVDACTNSFITSVTAEPFDPQLTGYSPPFCEGEDVVIYVDSINGATYSWEGPNGGILSTTHELSIPAVTFDNVGDYIVTVDVPGCAFGQVIVPLSVEPGPCNLPVELESFTAKVSPENTVLLNWIVANPYEIETYNIERSANGVDFDVIGSLASAEWITSYDYEDRPPLQQTYYYRLAITEITGDLTYSPIEVVKFSRISNLQLFSNMLAGQQELTTIVSGQVSELLVYNNNGQLMQSKKLETSSQISLTTTLSIGGLTSGVYYVRAIGAGFSETKPFVVVK